MKNTGTLFEDRFKSWHKGIDKVMCVKYPDARTSNSYSEAICDFLVLYKNRTIFMELKHTNNKISFAINLIKDHQLDKLLGIAITGNASFILIENGNRELFLIEPQLILAYIKNNKKSIKFNDLNNYKLTKETYIKLIS